MDSKVIRRSARQRAEAKKAQAEGSGEIAQEDFLGAYTFDPRSAVSTLTAVLGEPVEPLNLRPLPTFEVEQAPWLRSIAEVVRSATLKPLVSTPSSVRPTLSKMDSMDEFLNIDPTQVDGAGVESLGDPEKAREGSAEMAQRQQDTIDETSWQSFCKNYSGSWGDAFDKLNQSWNDSLYGPRLQTHFVDMYIYPTVLGKETYQTLYDHYMKASIEDRGKGIRDLETLCSQLPTSKVQMFVSCLLEVAKNPSEVFNMEILQLRSEELVLIVGYILKLSDQAAMVMAYAIAAVFEAKAARSQTNTRSAQEVAIKSANTLATQMAPGSASTAQKAAQPTHRHAMSSFLVHAHMG